MTALDRLSPAADTLRADEAPAAEPAIRIGIHGSPHLAARLVVRTGRAEDMVRWVPYDVADPFRELRSREADVMIVKYAPAEPDLAVSRPLLHDGRAAILGAHHPLAGRDSVSVEELADYDAFRRPGSFPDYVWDRVVPPYAPSGRPIRRVHPMTTVENMVGILAATLAVHLSFQSLDQVVPDSVTVVPIHDLPPAPVSLCWLREARLPSGVRQFITDAEAGSEDR